MLVLNTVSPYLFKHQLLFTAIPTCSSCRRWHYRGYMAIVPYGSEWVGHKRAKATDSIISRSVARQHFPIDRHELVKSTVWTAGWEFHHPGKAMNYYTIIPFSSTLLPPQGIAYIYGRMRERPHAKCYLPNIHSASLCHVTAIHMNNPSVSTTTCIPKGTGYFHLLR